MPVWLQALLPVASVAMTALLTWHLAQRRISIENVTQERAKWRENIRRTALDAHDAIAKGQRDKVERVRSELRTLVNPYDGEDCKLLACIAVWCLDDRKKWTEEFAQRVALLLKHDWERAKWEARSLKCFLRKSERKSTENAGNLKAECPSDGAQ